MRPSAVSIAVCFVLWAVGVGVAIGGGAAVARAEVSWSWDEITFVGGDGVSARDLAQRTRREVGGAGTTLRALRASLPRVVGGLAREGRLETAVRLESFDAAPPRVRVVRAPRALWDEPTVLLLGASVDTLRLSRATASLRALRGQAFEPDALERRLARWTGEAAESGFPFAVATVESLLVRDGRVVSGLRLDLGSAAVVRDVAFPGRRATREAHLLRLIGFREGEPFVASRWEARQRRLVRSDLFRTVGDPELSRGTDGHVRVSLALQERRTNRIEGALGYDGTSRRLSGALALELGNLFGTGRRFALRWDRPRTSERRLRVGYREPLLLGTPLAAEISLAQEVRDSTLDRAQADAKLEAPLGADFVVTAGLEYERATLGLAPAELRRRSGTLVGVLWDRLRPDAFVGSRVELVARSARVRVRPPGEATRSVRFDRAEFSAERYLRPAGLLARARVTAAGIAGESSWSEVEAYRVGGPRTLRGTAEESLLLRRFAFAQIEAGAELAGEGFAYLFVDAGWTREIGGSARSVRRAAYGAGLRSESESRTVQVDFGLPGGASFGEGRLHLSLESRF
mgnify:CR=1 FL=1